MPISMGDVIVVGGDIGSLTTALAIARQRHRVKILDGGDSVVAPGTGFHLTPGVMRALDVLGVGNHARGRAVPVTELLLDGSTGAPLTTVRSSAGPARRDHGWHSVIPGRHLLEPLRDACWSNPLIRIRPRSTVTGFEQRDGRVTALLASGERIHGDALIGADGLCSPVRLQLSGERDAVSASAMFHTSVPLDQVPPSLVSRGVGSAVTLWAGPDWQLVHYPNGERSLCLSVTCADRSGTVVRGAPVEAARVLEALSEACPAARDLVSLGTDWSMWVPCSRDPVTNWRDSRVVVTGEASWPTPLHAFPASGRAVEDALLLGNLMDCDPADFPQAFRAYDQQRRP
ncbi:FAD-dependent monooxygenase [Streptomyces sp. NPDC058576]|uniref:FAD-dependent monooxygenase n=1 Tax=Streptomyces sp. NPDC058576 TaxID=3346547 RepID=UPI003666D480